MHDVLVQSYLSELCASALRSASASRSARPSLALSAPSLSPHARASSSRSPVALCRNNTENNHHTVSVDHLFVHQVTHHEKQSTRNFTECLY